MNEVLASKRVLVVEDELLVSMLVEEILSDNGCQVVGPFTNVPEALLAAQREEVDLAVLDVNLRGTKVYPVAEILADRGIPFILISGYGRNAVPSNHPEWQVCSKPFTPHGLIEALTKLLHAHV